METGVLKLNRTEVKYGFLKDSNNNWMQLLYTIIPAEPEQIKDQIKTIEQAESELYKTFRIKNETAAWKRFFSSDLIGRFPGKYSLYAVYLFPIVFLMVPYFMIIENLDWKVGFRRGLVFWKRNFSQTFVLLIIVMLFLRLTRFLGLALIGFGGTCIVVAPSIIRTALRSFVSFFITAVIMVFCLEFAEAGALQE